jgi:hypothetical protein
VCYLHKCVVPECPRRKHTNERFHCERHLPCQEPGCRNPRVITDGGDGREPVVQDRCAEREFTPECLNWSFE